MGRISKKPSWKVILRRTNKVWLNPTDHKWWIIVSLYEVWTFESLERLRTETKARIGTVGQEWIEDYGWCEYVEIMPPAV